MTTDDAPDVGYGPGRRPLSCIARVDDPWEPYRRCARGDVVEPTFPEDGSQPLCWQHQQAVETDLQQRIYRVVKYTAMPANVETLDPAQIPEYGRTCAA